jgi:hypothetical protein
MTGAKKRRRNLTECFIQIAKISKKINAKISHELLVFDKPSATCLVDQYIYFFDKKFDKLSQLFKITNELK